MNIPGDRSVDIADPRNRKTDDEDKANAALIASAPALLVERDDLKLQVSEAMKACPWATHDVDHTEPKHCVAALSGLLQLRALEKQLGEKGNCAMCGALVERLYSLRCPACYDKLVADMGKRNHELPPEVPFTKEDLKRLQSLPRPPELDRPNPADADL